MPQELSNEELVRLGQQHKTQFNFRLPSGQTIPAGINPGSAATVDIAGTIFRPGSVFQPGGKLPTLADLTPLERGGTVPEEFFKITLGQLQAGAPQQQFQGGGEVIGVNEPGGQTLALKAAKTPGAGMIQPQQVPEGQTLREFTTPSGAVVKAPQIPGQQPGNLAQASAQQLISAQVPHTATDEEIDQFGEGGVVQRDGQSFRINPTGELVPMDGGQAPGGGVSSQVYTVQAGDTLSAIARKLGVGVNDITGFRSGDPNLIFPGEKLNVNKSQSAFPAPLPPSPETGVVSPIQPAEVFNGILEPLGLDVQSFSRIFSQNPQRSIKDLVSEVMVSTGLPEVKSQIEAIAKEIEEVENQMGDEIAVVNDNPWLSEALRSKKIIRIQERFEGRINSRVNRLKLLEDVADDARQQAQFAATLAVNQFNADRNFAQGQLEFVINAAERAADNKRLQESQDFTQSLGLAQLDLSKTRIELERERIELARNKAQGATGLSATEVRQTRERLDAAQKLESLVQDYKDIIDDKGFELTGAGNKGRLRALRADITAAFKDAKTLGALDAGVQTLVSDLIGPDPTTFLNNVTNIASFGAKRRAVQSQLDTVLKSIKSDVERDQERLGVGADFEDLGDLFTPEEILQINLMFDLDEGSGNSFDPALFF